MPGLLQRLPHIQACCRMVTCEDASSRLYAGWTTDCGAPFYLGLAVAGSQLAWQVRPQCAKCIIGPGRILVLNLTMGSVAELRAWADGRAAARTSCQLS